LAQVVILLAFIQELLGSNSGWNTSYSGLFFAVLLDPPGKWWDGTQN
jgi:hypothetical protein